MAKESKNKFSDKCHFILLIGDEGAVLTQVRKGAVVRRVFAQSPDPAHVKSLNEALSASPASPITVLFDVMDQSYVRQTLPPVSMFSVSKIINRRLNKDFAADDIKGYIILDREKTGRRDWNYMMVSLANNATMQKWLAFATERPNPFKGMGLLPLEAQGFMKALGKHLLKSAGNGVPLEWQILVSHNKVGGFRQIVMRDGRLAFTRMAQPFGEMTPAVIAGNIEQEIINTLEYLKRLGLQDQSQVSITILCSEEIKQSLDKKNIRAGEHHFFTPYEAGSLLSLKDAAQEGDSFGDVVISAYIAKQRRLLLTLHTPYTKRLGYYAMGLQGLKISGVLGTLAILGWIGSNIYDIVTTRQNIADLEAKHKMLASDLAKIKTRAETLPKSVNLYSDIMTLSQPLDKEQFNVLSLVQKLSDSTQGFALATTFQWHVTDPLAASKSFDHRQFRVETELHIVASPPLSQPQLVEQVQAFMGRVKQRFADCTVTYPDLPGVISDNKDIRTVIGDTPAAQDNAGNARNDIIKMEIGGPAEDKKMKAAGR